MGCQFQYRLKKWCFLFTILIVAGVTSALILLIEKVIVAKKSKQLEQHHVMDKIRALDDSFINVESGLVQRINALQIEAKITQENLNRLQYIYFMTNIDQNYSIIALNFEAVEASLCYFFEELHFLQQVI